MREYDNSLRLRKKSWLRKSERNISSTARDRDDNGKNLDVRASWVVECGSIEPTDRAGAFPVLCHLIDW